MFKITVRGPTHTAQIGHALEGLLECFVQALAHEGKGDATGTEVSGGAQERGMPEPQPHHAT